ncbi:MAG: DUF927 domain-containing protein [Lachnospiraceae bacterium]|nr:DUF927 domain-containing protein [Lachnospiraceae bacterium]
MNEMKEIYKNKVHYVGIRSVDRKNPEIVFEIKDCLNNKMVQLSIPRMELKEGLLEKIITIHNGICNSKELKGICEYLEREYNRDLSSGNGEISFFHTKLGWNKINDDTVFLGQEAVSQDDVVQSTYCGATDIQAQGNIDAYVNMVKRYIIGVEGWSKLEAMLAFGVGATVLAFANKMWGTFLNNFLLHMFGGSSNGKTTSMSLFVGLGTNPEKKKGLRLTYVSTENSIIKKIGNNNGFPVGIDELSAKTSREMDGFVYTVGNGEEKDRLMAGGAKFQESVTFESVFLSNGEVSIIKKCSQNEGIRARCIEFGNVQWTESKTQAEAINKCVHSNYGLVTPLVAKELLKNSDKWKKRWEYWRNKVETRIEKQQITLSIGGRIADYVALFTLSAEILNEVLGIELDVSKIYQFCYLHIIISNMQEADMARNAYEAIIIYISNHKDKFADACYGCGYRKMSDDLTLDSDMEGFFYYPKKKGEIKGEIYDMVYVFRGNILENILTDAGFTEIKVVLHQLNKAGYLKTKGGRNLAHPYTVNGSTIYLHGVFFKDDTMNAVHFDEASPW